MTFMVGFVYADTGTADIGEAVIWGAITLVGAAWLVTVFRRAHTAAAPWLRARVWP